MKKNWNKFLDWLAVLVFAASLVLIVCCLVEYRLLWLLLALWGISGVVGRVAIKRFEKRVEQLEGANNSKNELIHGLHDQRKQLFNRIAMLTEELEEAREALEEKKGMVIKDADLSPMTGNIALPKEQKNILPTLLDKMRVSITATEDMALPVIDTNLYLQPKEEKNRWWKLRGYDTALSDPDKEYYIYIRLAHKGFDGEVRFLGKPRLVQNEKHSFMQVGIIGPVIDGKRAVEYSLDAFRFKRINKA